MSGLVSGITKTFQAVGNAVTRVGSSILGVGATTMTAGVATGAGSMASGGLSGLFGGGTLGNIIGGAIKQAIPGMILGGITGALTGQGFMKGALTGGAIGAIGGGLMAGMNGLQAQPTGSLSAATPTGAAPTGVTMSNSDFASMPSMPSYAGMGSLTPAATAASATPTTTVPTGGNMLSNLLNSETGGGLLAGLGKGVGDYLTQKMTIDAQKAQQERELGYLRDKDKRIQDSYTVSDAAFASGSGKMRYEYDPAQGKIVMTGAA